MTRTNSLHLREAGRLIRKTVTYDHETNKHPRTSVTVTIATLIHADKTPDNRSDPAT